VDLYCIKIISLATFRQIYNPLITH